MATATPKLADVAALVDLAGEVAELPVGLVGRADHALRAMAKLLGARVAMAGHFVAGPDGQPTAIDPGRGHIIGIDPADWKPLAETVFTGELRFPAGRPLAETRLPQLTLRREQIIDDWAWYRDPYVNEVCRWSRSDDLVVSRVVRPDLGLDTATSFARDWGERRFTERDRTLVNLFHTRVAPRLFAEPPRPPTPTLPPRLRPVLARLLAGDAEKPVALKLGLSRHTVHQYVKVLYREMGVGSRSELLAKCLGRPNGGGAAHAQ